MRVAYTDLATGTVLHRIHSNRFGSIEYNGTKLGDARFSPLQNLDGTIVPTIYAAASFECAVCETILRSPDMEPINPVTGRQDNAVRPFKWRNSVHSTIRTLRELQLVDLTTQGQRRIGVEQNALLAGPTGTYPATRAWAEAIRAGCPDAHGLYYTSHQFGPAFAIVLFGDRAIDAIEQVDSPRPVSSDDCDREIRTLANGLGIEYEDL